ncbi:unnamed protein product [Hyaloperonospora brassicae]|uniref:RxLR effector candidate protein n=1 Tax=Hyaloperonospora brassicae TaxID=162125 RepID=A0AAV0TPV3_HYABA|nr:unnamed protein product [Hyaloperonospora brassicae]
MRTISILLLAAAAFVESASSSTSDPKALVSADVGPHDGPTETRFLESNTTDEARAFGLSFLTAKAQSFKSKMAKIKVPFRPDEGQVFGESAIHLLRLNPKARVTEGTVLQFSMLCQGIRARTVKGKNMGEILVKMLLPKSNPFQLSGWLLRLKRHGASKEADEAFEVLIKKWATEIKSIDDVLTRQIGIPSKFDDLGAVLKVTDNIVIADKLISAYNTVKKTKHPTILEKMSGKHDDDIARYIASMDFDEPLVRLWQGHQFRKWVDGNVHFNAVYRILGQKKGDPASANLEAIGSRYEAFYKSQKKDIYGA